MSLRAPRGSLESADPMPAMPGLAVGEPPLRVGLVGHPPAGLQGAREMLRRLRMVECDAHTGRPGAVLCAAAAPWRMVELLSPMVRPFEPEPRLDAPVEYRAPIILLDLMGEIGQRVAALHAIHSYLAPERPAEEWRACLQAAARHRRYGAGPAVQEFYETWGDGPLTELEWKDLRLAGLGLKQRERAAELHKARSTLQRYEDGLKERLDSDPQWRVRAIAVALGFCRYWPVRRA